MSIGRKVFTSNDVAKKFGVATRTVHGWCEKKLIRYWTLPESNHRRFNYDDVVAFAKEYDLPLDDIQ